MLLNNTMKYIGIACDYLPSQQVCTVIDIVQDFLPFRCLSKNIIKGNQLNHNKSQQNFNISFANNRKIEYCRSPQEITINSRIFDSEMKNNIDSMDENINDRSKISRFSMAGENYKNKYLKKYDTDKLTHKEKIEILKNVNRHKFNPKTFIPFKEKVSYKKNNYFNEGDDYNYRTNKSIIFKNRDFSYDINQDRERVYFNNSGNNLNRSCYNISREMLKNEIKDEVKDEIKTEVLNEIYSNPNSFYDTNKKQIRYYNFFENDINNSNYNNRSYNNYRFNRQDDKYNSTINKIKNLNRNNNKCFSTKKCYYNNNYNNDYQLFDNNSSNLNQVFFDQKNNQGPRFRSYDRYYEKEKYDNLKKDDGGMELKTKYEETYEKIKKDDNPLPYEHSYDYDLYVGENNSYNPGGSINLNKSKKSKKEYKKLIKMFNIIKAEKNNKNYYNNLTKSSNDNYGECQNCDIVNNNTKINEGNNYFNNSPNQNEQSLHYIEVEDNSNDLQNTTEGKYTKDHPYKIDYSKIESKNEEIKYPTRNEITKKKFNIEISENDNINNLQDLDIATKKTGKFYEFEGNIENKEVNINDLLDKDTVYKKINFKPIVEKKQYNKNGNDITTVTTKTKEIYSSEKPVIKQKIITSQKSFYDAFYGKEKSIYSKKKYERLDDRNYQRKNIDIISMESDNMLPYDYNNDCRSYDFIEEGKSYGETEKLGGYNYQNANIMNYNSNTYNEPRGGIFPFYKGKNINNSKEFRKDEKKEKNNCEYDEGNA